MTPSSPERPDKAARHRAFWTCRDATHPLLGAIVGGWSYFRQNRGADTLWGDGYLEPDMLRPEAFVQDYRELLERYDELGDDLVHTAEPFAAVPWLEAIAGCPVRRSHEHFWAEPVPEALDRPDAVEYDPDNPWARKYLEFLDVFADRLAPDYPVAQSVVRGPADVASALLGEVPMVFAFNDEPEKMRRLLDRITALSEAFLRHQSEHIPRFCGGSVVGVYEIWAPGWALRLQEDAMGLLSPGLYRGFVAPLDARLTSLSPYNLFHIHTTAFHLLADLLQLPALAAVEISRDDGVESITETMAACKQVRKAGRPLVVTGRFSQEEMTQFRRELEPDGLCILAVVDTWDQGERMLRFARSLW